MKTYEEARLGKEKVQVQPTPKVEVQSAGQTVGAASAYVKQLQRYHCMANSPAAVRVVAAAEPDAGAVAQLKVTHDGTKYVGDGTRPGWRKSLKVNVASEYGVAASANFASMGMDRAHRMPFAKIEEMVVSYCNGLLSGANFGSLTDALYDSSDAEYKPMTVARDALTLSLSGTVAGICKAANALLSHLNSSSFNVSAGDDSTNRSIQDDVDYNYVQDPSGSGKYVLTPRSQQLHDAFSGVGMEPDFPLTPKGKHVKSSQFSSAQQSGQKVPMADVDM